MAVINRQPPSMGTCANCKLTPIRVVGWSLAENTGQGWQGMGAVHLCVGCMRAQAEALEALPPFIEEIRYDLRQRTIPYPPKASLADLLALQRGEAPKASGTPVPALLRPTGPQTKAWGKPVEGAPPVPVLEALLRQPRASLQSTLEGPPYNVVGIPATATKRDLATRIVSEAMRLNTGG